MNLKDLDLMSFAGAVGHQAAARLFGVLENDETGLANNWFSGGYVDFDAEIHQPALDELAKFICERRENNGAVTWGNAIAAGIYELEEAAFEHADYSVRIAYITFSRVTLATYLDLQSQLQIQLTAEAEGNPAPKPSLAPEGSILEQVDGVADEVAHADGLRTLEAERVEAERVEAERVEAERVEAESVLAQAEKNARNAKRRAARANAKAAKADEKANVAKASARPEMVEVEVPEAGTVKAGGDAGDGSSATNGGAQQTPLSAGEPLAKHSKAKGGRPRKPSRAKAPTPKRK